MSSFLPKISSVTAIALFVVAGMASPANAAMSSRRVQAINCSSAELISAINEANAARKGTIELPSNCTISLTAAYVEATTRGPNGLPIIREEITITGGTNSVIERAVGSPAFRILEVACGSRLTLQNVILQNGDSGANTGGAVLNARGTIVMSSSTVRDSTGDNGAGISNDTGILSLDATTVSGNTARGGGAGGIYNDGTLKMTRGGITGNTANTSGGAVYNEQHGTVDISSSAVINDNRATLNHGGAFYNDDTAGQMTINYTNMQSNSAGGMGGLVYNESTLTLARAVVRYNTSGTEGGAIMNAATGNLSLVGVSIAYNVAGTQGGGIYNVAGGVVTRSGGSITTNTPNNCAPPGSVPGCTN